MTIPVDTTKTPTRAWAELRRLMTEHPHARIVTTHLAAPVDEEYELSAVAYHPTRGKDTEKIELEFYA